MGTGSVTELRKSTNVCGSLTACTPVDEVFKSFSAAKTSVEVEGHRAQWHEHHSGTTPFERVRFLEVADVNPATS